MERIGYIVSRDYKVGYSHMKHWASYIIIMKNETTFSIRFGLSCICYSTSTGSIISTSTGWEF